MRKLTPEIAGCAFQGAHHIIDPPASQRYDERGSMPKIWADAHLGDGNPSVSQFRIPEVAAGQNSGQSVSQLLANPELALAWGFLPMPRHRGIPERH
jgi:hypothetical protein